MLRLQIAFVALSGVIFLSCAPTDHPVDSTAQRRINASNDSIRYTGRIKHEVDSVTIYWPGTIIEIKFKGTTVSANLRDEFGQNYFNVVVDGRMTDVLKVKVRPAAYLLADSLADGEHVVQLIKRTEWDHGKTWFYGFEIDGELKALGERNKRVIEFFGNSITAGYAIEDKSGRDSPDSTNTNNYNTYASLTARHFQADCYLTIKSGIGILVSWFPLIMPELYNRLDPTDSTSRWDFHIKPQVVVINLFQNDSWLVKKPEHPSFIRQFGIQPPDDATITAAYKAFVSKVRAAYPDAHIICALGCMDAVKAGSPWRQYVTDAVTQLHDEKVLTYFFPYCERNGHPTEEDNKLMAENLIKFIEANVQW
jgi:hypothetical protein